MLELGVGDFLNGDVKVLCSARTDKDPDTVCNSSKLYAHLEAKQFGDEGLRAIALNCVDEVVWEILGKQGVS